MGIENLISEIDAEIVRLQEARALLAGAAAPGVKKVGRPAKATVVVKTAAKAVKKKKRNLTPEGRARIAAAVKARWAKQKKAEK
jgi:hypothetical protein